MDLTYFVDNKLGGVSSLNYNLAGNGRRNGLSQRVIHITVKGDKMTPAGLIYPESQNIPFEYSVDDSAYATIDRLRQLLPATPGALVVNYELEMQMLDHYPSPHSVYQLVHDDYNVGLAVKYGHVVDVFIAHNRFIFEKLRQLLPHRDKDIFFLKHGVPIPPFYRQHQAGDAKPGEKALKLLFLGRMDARKGIFDLPVIDELLAGKGIAVSWTCIGNGPELETLKKRWKNADVGYRSPSGNEEVLKIAAEHDVFVLPTKFEGSPVSLLETMSLGLVPVITDLPGGIREVVDEATGFRIAQDDNHGFAAAIEKLNHDRRLLATMSTNSRETIVRSYDVKQTAAAYHDLFGEYDARFREKEIRREKIGSRLDRPWLPSFIKRTLRAVLSKKTP